MALPDMALARVAELLDGRDLRAASRCCRPCGAVGSRHLRPWQPVLERRLPEALLRDIQALAALEWADGKAREDGLRFGARAWSPMQWRKKTLNALRPTEDASRFRARKSWTRSARGMPRARSDILPRRFCT